MRMPIGEPNWHAPGPGTAPRPRQPLALLTVLMMPLAIGVTHALLLVPAFLFDPELSAAQIWPLAIGALALALPLAHLLAACLLGNTKPVGDRPGSSG